MDRIYEYIGPEEIALRVSGFQAGHPVLRMKDAEEWIRARKAGDCITVTFVVDEGGTLLISDRSSEHVACAGLRPVRAAGEMSLALESEEVRVTSVTNQSTGYCPEPDSWGAVSVALARAGLASPKDFSAVYLFRRCMSCGTINILKDRVFRCSVCDAALPSEWNLARQKEHT